MFFFQSSSINAKTASCHSCLSTYHFSAYWKLFFLQWPPALLFAEMALASRRRQSAVRPFHHIMHAVLQAPSVPASITSTVVQRRPIVRKRFSRIHSVRRRNGTYSTTTVTFAVCEASRDTRHQETLMGVQRQGISFKTASSS